MILAEKAIIVTAIGILSTITVATFNGIVAATQLQIDANDTFWLLTNSKIESTGGDKVAICFKELNDGFLLGKTQTEEVPVKEKKFESRIDKAAISAIGLVESSKFCTTGGWRVLTSINEYGEYTSLGSLCLGKDGTRNKRRIVISKLNTLRMEKRTNCKW